MQIHIPDPLHRKLKLTAVQENKTMSQLLTEYVEEGLKKTNAEQDKKETK
jgi:hypothetical protein